MNLKRESQFGNLIGGFFLLAIIALVSNAVGWTHYQTENEFVSLAAFFAFITLTRIGEVLERIDRKMPERHEEEPITPSAG